MLPEDAGLDMMSKTISVKGWNVFSPLTMIIFESIQESHRLHGAENPSEV